MTNSERGIFPLLKSTIESLTANFGIIPTARMDTLIRLSGLIQAKVLAGKTVNLNFICTHNSRRSHMAQLWAQAATHYYGIPSVNCFSGGTEASAFNERAVKAMQDAGFRIVKIGGFENPQYAVQFSNEIQPLIAFSKKYNDPFNPQQDFVALMTCSQADGDCPFIPGAAARITIPYDDPKAFDGTPQEAMGYAERSHQIGREILYCFSQIQLVPKA